MAIDNNYSIYIPVEYRGMTTSEKTGKKYYTFCDCFDDSAPLNRTIWVKEDEFSKKIMSDADPEKGDMFKLKVTAVPFNGSAFLGYSVVGVL